MARLLIVSMILAAGAAIFIGRSSSTAPGPAAAIAVVRETVADTTPRFRARLEAGADCAELSALRDTYAPDSPEVARMNTDLLAIGCITPTSARTR